MSNENIFKKWDREINTVALAADIREAEQNGGTNEFKEVPHGDYEVAIHKMELKESKKGSPMVSIWFKIVSDGEFKGSMIFYNQVVNYGFQIHLVNDMLRKIVSEMEDADEYLARIDHVKTAEDFSYEVYGNLIMDIFEVTAESFEYALSYTANGKNKNFNDYKIKEVFVLE